MPSTAGLIAETIHSSPASASIQSVISGEPPLPRPGTRRPFAGLATLTARIPVPVVAIAASLAIAALVVLGVRQRTRYPLWQAANLDSEESIGMWFSAGLLWAGAACWLLVAVSDRLRGPSIWIWWPAMAWLALDEGNGLHERLERWSGIDWQLLYLPVIGVIGAAWWGVLRRQTGGRRVTSLLAAGAAAWAIALVLELIQNWGGVPVRASIYDPAMITEEALELIGSVMFLLAGLLVLQRSPEEPPVPQPDATLTTP